MPSIQKRGIRPAAACTSLKSSAGLAAEAVTAGLLCELSVLRRLPQQGFGVVT